MPDDRPSLDYARPVPEWDRPPRDSPFGLASCAVCGCAVISFGAFYALALSGSSWAGPAGGVAVWAVALCPLVGMPLAFRGLSSEAYRKRLAHIGLWSNVIWTGVAIAVLCAGLPRQ